MCTQGLSARYAVQAGVMLNRDVSWLATFEEGFDRVEGINRVEHERGAQSPLRVQGYRLTRAAAPAHISYASRNSPSSSTVTGRTGLNGIVR